MLGIELCKQHSVPKRKVSEAHATLKTLCCLQSSSSLSTGEAPWGREGVQTLCRGEKSGVVSGLSDCCWGINFPVKVPPNHRLFWALSTVSVHKILSWIRHLLQGMDWTYEKKSMFRLCPISELSLPCAFIGVTCKPGCKQRKILFTHLWYRMCATESSGTGLVQARMWFSAMLYNIVQVLTW